MKRIFLLALFFVFCAAIVLILSLTQAQPSAAAPTEISLDVNYAHDWANAHTDPNTQVIFKVKRNSSLVAEATGQTDAQGDLWSGDLP